MPIGLFLSAGIDSSLIAAICAKDLRQDLQTFTVTFPDGLDEAKQAERIASHLGIIHKTIEVSDDPFKGDLPKALKSFYGIPTDNLTAVSVYQLSLAARPSIKVALSGTGGDELAVGYNKYDFLRKRRLAYQMSPKMASLAASTLEMLFLHRKAEMVRTFLVGGNMHRVSALKNGRASNRLTSLSNLVDLPAVTSRDRSWVNKMRSFDLEATLPASYISSVDRGSMRAGLEVRCPYLNTELFEYVAGFDSSNLIGKGRKYLLKTILARYLPKAFFEKPKTGFVRPVSKWARSIENPFKNSALETPFLPNPEDHNEVMIALRLRVTINGERMKIILLLPSLDLGGAERQAVLIANSLATDGHQVSMVIFKGGGSLTGTLDKERVELVLLEVNGPVSAVKALTGLLALTSRGGADVIYSFLPPSNLVAGFIGLMQRKLRIIWGLEIFCNAHAFLVLEVASTLLGRTEINLDVNGIITNSVAGQAKVPLRLKQKGLSITIPNAIDTDLYFKDKTLREGALSRHRLAPETIAIGIVARMDPVKDHFTL